MQKQNALLLAALCLTFAFATGSRADWADPKGVGLGVAAGVAIPNNSTYSFQPALNWGFFVDIPILDSFHITPSTMLYKLRDNSGLGSAATDVSLNFKFTVPLSRLDIYLGATVGLTSTESIDPHVGALAGLTIHLLPNLGVFAQVDYKYVLRDDNVGGNVRDLEIYAGPMFRF